jgi:hypothetical protein
MAQIRVLIVSANPAGTTPLKLDEEVREIEAKIRAAEHRDSLELITKWAARPDDLLQALNEHSPHVVHFSGHGSPTDEIILLDKVGAPKPVSKDALVSLFRTLKDNIRVVLLNACYSRSQAQAITAEIDCAIGMRRAVGDTAAIVFAASFYRAIGFGRSVQDAFDQGITSLLLEGVGEEHTPELIVRPGIDAASVLLVNPRSLSEKHPRSRKTSEVRDASDRHLVGPPRIAAPGATDPKPVAQPTSGSPLDRGASRTAESPSAPTRALAGVPQRTRRHRGKWLILPLALLVAAPLLYLALWPGRGARPADDGQLTDPPVVLPGQLTDPPVDSPGQPTDPPVDPPGPPGPTVVSKADNPGETKVTVVASRTPASTNFKQPARLEVGTYVSGILDVSEETGKYHYWLLDIPEGKYKLVLDVQRSDGGDSNIGATLDWCRDDGKPYGVCGWMNLTDCRSRMVLRFALDEPVRTLLRVDMKFSTSDYQLGLLRESDPLPAPFFVKCPKVTPLRLGDAVTTPVMHGASPYDDVYYSVHLEAGHYEVSARFNWANGDDRYLKGTVKVLSAEGHHDDSWLVFEHGTADQGALRGVAKLTLAEKGSRLLQVRATGAQAKAVITVKEWPSK